MSVRTQLSACSMNSQGSAAGCVPIPDVTEPTRPPVQLQDHSRTFNNAMSTAFAEQAASYLGSLQFGIPLVLPPTNEAHLQGTYRAAEAPPGCIITPCGTTPGCGAWE